MDSDADPAVLLARAEAIGGGVAGVAVCGVVRPELLVVDLDGCAELVMSRVIAAATAAGAVLAYVAASGSPDSRHVLFAVTPAIRAAAVAAIAGVRAATGLDANTLDVRGVTHHLRFPGSASLKGGGRCVPVTVDGAPMSAIAAAERLRTALAAVDVAGELDLSPEPPPITPTRIRPRAAPSPPPPAAVDGGELEVGPWDLEPDRAWRDPTPITTEGWKTLHTAVDPHLRRLIKEKRASAADTARWARENESQLATDGAWVLYRSGIRGWRVARHFYRRHRCFAKFTDRDTAARAAGKKADHSFKHWQRFVEDTTSWTKTLDAADQALIDAALAEVAHWDDPDLVAAGAAAIRYRFANGHGTINRPLSERCMAIWLSVPRMTARRRIAGLVERGLLTLVTPHDRHTARHEAHCYTLRVPSPMYRTSVVHDLTRGGSLHHPVWGTLGQRERHVHEKLGPEPLATAQLALLTGQPAGTATHGVLRALKVLEPLGLATRHGTGTATTWTRGPNTLDDAATTTGTTDRHHVLVATITTERTAWHATTHRTSATARTRLAYLHQRQHGTTDRARTTGPAQLTLFTTSPPPPGTNPSAADVGPPGPPGTVSYAPLTDW